jgi:mono/diheme cytochrome c family protein
MQERHIQLAAAIVLASLMTRGEAQEVGQAGRGLLTAQRLCVQCHAVEKGQARSPNAKAPSFPTIAAVPGMTATALSAALNTSHRLMPNILLEPEDQANIIAYILTLK